jgi:hypothetical protein
MPDGTSILGRPTAAVMASPPKPKEVNLLGNLAMSPPKPTTAPKQENKSLVDDLFDSFQTAPMASTVASPPKSTTDDILSLFSTPASTVPAVQPMGMGIFNPSSNAPAQPVNGHSLLGDFDAFSAFQSTPSQPIQSMASPQSKPMTMPISQLVPSTNSVASPSLQPTKQDDLFADFVSFSNATKKPNPPSNDVWGDFK